MKAAEPLNLDRRRFLKGAVLFLSASVLPQAPASSFDTGASVESWQTLFPDLRTAAAFGRQYLRQHQHEASGPWLTEQLLGGELPLGGGEAVRDAIMGRIRRGRQRDFRAGDVVVIDGWFFARTEARLMALVSMTPA